MKKSSLFIGIAIAAILGLLVIGGGAVAIWWFVLRVTPETALSNFETKTENITSAEFDLDITYDYTLDYGDGSEPITVSSTYEQLAKDDYENEEAYIEAKNIYTNDGTEETLTATIYVIGNDFYEKTPDDESFRKNELTTEAVWEDETGLESYFKYTWWGTFIDAVVDNEDKFEYMGEEEHNGVKSYKYETTDTTIALNTIGLEVSDFDTEEVDSTKVTLWIGKNGLPVGILVEMSLSAEDEGITATSSVNFSIEVSNINKVDIEIPSEID